MEKPNMLDAKKRTKNEVFVKTEDYNINDNLKTLGAGKKYHIKTYGCQMNEHDTENIKAILEDLGFTECSVMEESDFILLNTCAIRENAHNKTFGMIGRIKHLKETKPHVMAGICGCMAQEESVVNKILDKYKWLDIVFGTHNIHNLPNLLNSAMAKRETEIEVYSKEGEVYENIPVKRDNPYKAWINIIYGCDKFCTYCIVPYTRGKERSRKPDYIIDEVKKLVLDGYKEVTLLGQNVNAYGKDLNNEYGMKELLLDISKTGIDRIRFTTSHPWDFSDDMIKVIAENDNIMPYIHLPVQSGSSKILKLMGRRYTKESYLELFNKIKIAIPKATITTDIIVGFPGETEEDFNETLNLVKECKFDSAFTFLFSPRVGTPAASMEDNISKEDKNKRLYKLNEIVNGFSKESNDKLVGTIVPVLVENVSTKKEGTVAGFSDTMKLVNFKGTSELIGKIVDVKITKAKTWSLDGKIVSVN